MKEHVMNILKEVAANPPSMEELARKADIIVNLFEKKEEEKEVEPIKEEKRR